MLILDDKFWNKVDKTDQCWIWTGRTYRKYGAYSHKGKKYRAHRAVWESIHGAIPVGMVICHKCDNPSCVNPDHLFIGTQADNVRDCKEKGRIRHGDYLPPPIRGSANPNAKLKESDVIEIRKAHQNGATQLGIAKQYGVHPSIIWQIIHGRAWTHV